MKKQSKEQLQKQLQKIIEEEVREFTSVHYPEFKKLEGRYFKYRNNYSSPKKASDYWFVYIKIVEVRPEDVYMIHSGPTCHLTGWSFESDPFGEVSIKTSKNGYAHALGTEISETEFLNAWNKLADRLNILP